MTTTVTFELSRIVSITPELAWQCLTDWQGHGDWIPLTRVDVDPADPDRFTAWTGIGPLALEDRMRLVDQQVDGTVRRARIAKLGPVLVGEAQLSVSPGLRPDTAVVQWLEVVEMPHLPKALAPAAGWIAKQLFTMALGRMGRHTS